MPEDGVGRSNLISRQGGSALFRRDAMEAYAPIRKIEDESPRNSSKVAVKLPTSKRRIVAVAASIVLALFLLRPGGSRLKSRIVSSMSSAVGRSGEICSVYLRLLPRPG